MAVNDEQESAGTAREAGRAEVMDGDRGSLGQGIRTATARVAATAAALTDGQARVASAGSRPMAGAYSPLSCRRGCERPPGGAAAPGHARSATEMERA